MFSWVSKLSFKNKFLIIFCAFVSVIGFLLYQIEALRYDTYSFSNKELTGYKHISKLYAEIQPNLLKNKINI